MRKLFVTASLLPLLAVPGIASADTSLGLRGGTLGGGVELSHAFGQRTGVRLNADGYNFKQTSTYDNIDYDMKLKLRTASLMGDWFPFANNFRISAGAMFNGNKLTLKGLPTNGFYTINGIPYSTAQIESLDAAVDFNKAAPYFGIGYGRPINSGTARPRTRLVGTSACLRPAGAPRAMRSGAKRRASRAIQARRKPSQLQVLPGDFAGPRLHVLAP